MNILLSNKIGIEEIIKNHPPKFPGYKKDKLMDLISRVYVGTLNKEEYDSGEDQAVPLCTKILEKLLGNSYKLHLEYLKSHNILQTVSGYIPGESCKGYQLNHKYLGVPEWYTITDFTLKRCLKRNSKKAVSDQYPYLTKWFKHLTVDIEQATVSTNILYELKKKCPEYRDRIIGTDRRKDPERQFYHALMMLEHFKNKEYPFYVDEKGKRAHTLITRSNKIIRRFISLDGHPLVSVDLKNSQPYLLLCLTNDKHFSNKKGGDLQIYRQTTPPPTKSPISSYNLDSLSISSIMFYNSSEILTSIEFQEYKKLVASGRIYEFFEDKLTIKEEELRGGMTKRDLIKYRMMLCLYSKNRGYSGGLKTVFKKHFPKLYRFMCEIKEVKHSTLAILLQRIESYLILDVICKRISEERPTLPLFTIHDCIATTVGNEQYIADIIKEEMERYVGVAPMVSFDYWDPRSVEAQFIEIDRKLSKEAA